MSKTINPFKIKNLTPEQSRIVQECVFRNGYTRINYKTDICESIRNLIFHNKDSNKYSLYATINTRFEDKYYYDIPELTFNEFQVLYNDAKWCVRGSERFSAFINKVFINDHNYTGFGEECVFYVSPDYWHFAFGNLGPDYIELPIESFDKLFINKQEVNEFKEFVLPEKWCIERIISNYKLVNDWVNKNPIGEDNTDYNGVEGYINSELVHDNVYNRLMFHIVPGFTEITTEQFIKYVINKDIGKKIIGYKAPIDLFHGKIKSGQLFGRLDMSDNNYDYCPINDSGYPTTDTYFTLPKEIVETWEPVYEVSKPKYEVGEWLYVKRDGSETIFRYKSERGDTDEYYQIFEKIYMRENLIGLQICQIVLKQLLNRLKKY